MRALREPVRPLRQRCGLPACQQHRRIVNVEPKQGRERAPPFCPVLLALCSYPLSQRRGRSLIASGDRRPRPLPRSRRDCTSQHATSACCLDARCTHVCSITTSPSAVSRTGTREPCVSRGCCMQGAQCASLYRAGSAIGAGLAAIQLRQGLIE
ncbi:hypothetical protein BD414DRAFT_297941 [Trametes punicea]|nr:hypothetical protein BD414DRAFT_297941 [Trametes punicea]